MEKNLTVGDLIEVPAVRTVVRLADLAEPRRAAELLEGFLVTEDAASVLQSFLGAIERREGGGFFLQGDFGSGKSHTLAVLAQALRGKDAAEVLGRALGRRLSLPPACVVTISLLEYDAQERLEDIVAEALSQAVREQSGTALAGEIEPDLIAEIRNRLAKQYPAELERFLAQRGLAPSELFCPESTSLLSELISRLNLPYRIRIPRKRLWESLRSHLGQMPVVLLFDELSEFLRSKGSDSLFQEDVRYLQFLGERASGEPLWILATLQEWIEETGELKQETFQKIKDRYPFRFRLSGRHVEQLITQRLVRKKPGAEGRLLALWGELTEAFGEVGFTAENFVGLYPVHPGTLRFLSVLGPLFSQHRGVVDFIHYLCGCAPAGGIKGLLGEPATELLTADRIFDHFELRLREIAVYRPYVETVWRYFLREAPRIFQDEQARTFALRALKVLILAEISPEEKKPSCRDVARLLVRSVTTLDPEANYDYAAGILSRLEREGAYLERIAGPTPAEDTYRVRLEADLRVLLKRKTQQVAERLNLSDPLLAGELLPLLEDGYLPLARLPRGRPLSLTCKWQGTQRVVNVFLCHIASLKAEDVTRWQRELDGDACEVVLVVGMPLDSFEGDPVPALFFGCPKDLPLVFWLPREPGDLTEVRDALARVQLRARLRREQTVAAGKFLAALEGYLREDKAQLIEWTRSRYLKGSIHFPGEDLSPGSIGLMPFSQFVARVADHALVRRYPRHKGIMPRTELHVADRLDEVLARFLLPGRLAPDSTSRLLHTLIEGYLSPLKLVAKERRELVLRIDPEVSPAVKALLERLGAPGGTPVRSGHIEGYFRRGPFGMSRDQYLLFLAAAVASGQVKAWVGERELAPGDLTEKAIRSIRYLARGDVLPEQLRKRFSEAPYLPEELRRRDLSSVRVQKELWDFITVLSQETLGQIAQLRQSVEQCRTVPEFARLPFESLLQKAASVASVMEQADRSLSPRDGLERFLCRERQVPSFSASLAELRYASEFLTRHREAYLQARKYLAGAEAVLARAPHEPVWSEAQSAFEQASASAVSPEILTDPGAFQRLQADFEIFLERYITAYRQSHDECVGEVRFAPYRALYESAPYKILRALARLAPVEAEGAFLECTRSLSEVLRKSCRGADVAELRMRPVCRCLWDDPRAQELVSPQVLHARMETAVKEVLSRVVRSPRQEKLQAAVSALRHAERHEEATAVQKFLQLCSADAPDLEALAAVCEGGTVTLLARLCEGGVPVVTRSLSDLTESLAERSFSPSALEGLFRQWLYRGENLPEDAVVRVRRGAGEDDMHALPGSLTDRFPELLEEARREGPSQVARSMVLSVWAEAHGFGPEALELEPERAAFFAEAGRHLRAHEPEAFTRYVEATEEELPATFWRSILTAAEAAEEPGVLLAAALREELFGSFLKLCAETGLSVVLRSRHVPELSVKEAHSGAGRLALERKRAARCVDLARRFLRHMQELERELWCVSAEDWQKAFTGAVAPAVFSFTALVNTAGGLGLALETEEAARYLAENVRRYEEGFAALGRKGRGRPLRIDELDRRLVDPSREVFRPKRVVRILLDGLRYDVWLCLKEEFLPGLRGTFRIVQESCLWAYEPSNTETQLEKLGVVRPGSPFGLRVVSREEFLRNGDPEAIVKIDYLDQYCHTLRGDLAEYYREALSGAGVFFQGILESLPARSLVLLFGDHGFTESSAFSPQRKYEAPRYIHGGSSLFEVMAPAVLLFKV